MKKTTNNKNLGYEVYKGERAPNTSNGKSITFFIPFIFLPATTGYAKRLEFILKYLNERFEKIYIHLYSHVELLKEEEKRQRIMQYLLPQCNLLFDYSVPQHSKGIIKIHYWKALLKVLFTGRFVSFTNTLIIDKYVLHIFKKIIRKYPTDYFFNTRHQYGGLISVLPDDIYSLIDTQDIFTQMYFKFGFSEIVGKRFRKKIKYHKDDKQLFLSERNMLKSYNKMIAISAEDYSVYNSYAQLHAKSELINACIDESSDYPFATFKNKEIDLLFVGSHWKATSEGVDWFFNQVVPFLSSEKKLKITFVGTIGTHVIENRYMRTDTIDVDIPCVVDDLTEYYKKAKIVIIPILSGTGISVKFLEAGSYGSCVITTAQGCRGAGVKHFKHCIISDEAEDFAKWINLLLSDDKLRHTLGINLHEFIISNFSKTIAYQKLDQIFSSNEIRLHNN